MNNNNTSLLLMCNGDNLSNKVLDALKDLTFEIHHFNKIEEALSFYESNITDIVLTEYDLGESHGIDFLKSIYKISKSSTRLIIGQQADEELIIKAIVKGVACAYIEKPDIKNITQKITDVARVRKSMANESISKIINDTNEFPINMEVYEQLIDRINNDVALPEIAALISKDISLTAKVLRVANSAFYGNFNGSSIEKAIIYMGLSPIKDIVLLHSLSSNLKMSSAQNDKLEEIIKHSIETNYYMHAIAKKAGNCPITSLNNSIGIIHDIGKLVQLVYFPLEYNIIDEFREENPAIDYYNSELQTGNESLSHSEIGAYFLRCWNFNQYSVEAALFHHSPEEASHDMKPCVEALYLANTIADIRDGYKLSLDDALERCTRINLEANDILTILPPV